MKNYFLFICGSVGALITSLIGGWDGSIINLLILMGIDYITGIICAAIFKKSKKTKTGALSSAVCLKGLLKKGMILVLVVIANILDNQIGIDYIRDMVCIAFIINETISILENAGAMGIPIPKALLNAIDILKTKEESGNGNE